MTKIIYTNLAETNSTVVEQADIHTTDVLQAQLEKWQQRQIELQLPSYSLLLNLIEILWRFIKYELLEVSAYCSWQCLVEYVARLLREFGENYVINFV